MIGRQDSKRKRADPGGAAVENTTGPVNEFLLVPYARQERVR